MEHLRKKRKRICVLWQRERKVTIIPFSSVSSFPFIAAWQMHKASVIKQQNRHTVN